MRNSDTIAAVGTPPGESALAVIRISGPLAARFGPWQPGVPPPARRVVRGSYRDRSGRAVDDVLFTYFAGPASYTGEDVLEISCHGNPFLIHRILDDLAERGARSAEPGEFTRRAFLAGKMDLSQAEAVMDLIRARSDRALDNARRLLRGELGHRISALTARLTGLVASVEAYIDFPEEDLPEESVTHHLEVIRAVRAEAGRLARTGEAGRLLRDGVPVLLAGVPNAGKSSLLNRLLGFERALVSPEPGTTRDFLEEPLPLGRNCIRIIDTAGLGPARDGLERSGMERTLAKAAEADLFLLVLDGSLPSPTLPAELTALARPEKTLVAVNKTDLPPHPAAERGFEGYERLRVSALTGAGLDALETALGRRIALLTAGAGEEGVAVSQRHAQALEAAMAALDRAARCLDEGEPAELAASELREALHQFGEIVGRVDQEEILDVLFSRFCIGK